MKRKGKFVVLVLAFILAMVLAVPATASPHALPQAETTSQVAGEVFQVGTDAAYPPFEEIDEDGNYVGFDIELMEAIAEDAGFEIEWINAPFDTIFTALAEGQFDMVISASTITEERAEIVDFSDPYYDSGQIISVTVDMAEMVATPEDLAGLRVGVQLGTTGEMFAEELEGIEVLSFDTAPLAFQALGQGEVDAVIVDLPTSEEIIATNPDLGVVTVGEPLTDESYGIAVNQDLPELLEAVNLSLANVIEDGTYAEIFEEWFGYPPGEDWLPPDDDMDDDADEDMDDDMDDDADDDMDDDSDDDMEATEEPSDSE